MSNTSYQHEYGVLRAAKVAPLPIDKAQIDLVGSTAPESPTADMALLRELLLHPEQQRIAALEQQVTELQTQLQQQDLLVTLISPLVAPLLARSVHESRDAMAEALYPVIGKAIVRAVNEAMRDLAQSIDTSLRRNLRPQWLQRLQWRMQGVDPHDVALRQALPFEVRELFLIHRDSGLLILHHSTAVALNDADIIGGMLSAIRGYVHDSFTPEAQGSLDAISYGNLRILIEDGSAAILAVVMHGIEPKGFQSLMRQQLSELHGSFWEGLHGFRGDPLDAQLITFLYPLMETADDST